MRIATTGREGIGAGLWVAEKELPLSVGKRFSGGVRTVTRGGNGDNQVPFSALETLLSDSPWGFILDWVILLGVCIWKWVRRVSCEGWVFGGFLVEWE